MSGMDAEYERLIDKLNDADAVRTAIIERFKAQLKASESMPVVDVDDPLFREWDSADHAVASAREAIRDYFRYRGARLEQSLPNRHIATVRESRRSLCGRIHDPRNGPFRGRGLCSVDGRGR
jgi:hypothetical protein